MRPEMGKVTQSDEFWHGYAEMSILLNADSLALQVARELDGSTSEHVNAIVGRALVNATAEWIMRTGEKPTPKDASNG